MAELDDLNWKDVRSESEKGSWIKAIAIDHGNKKLFIETASGKAYAYEDVDEEVLNTIDVSCDDPTTSTGGLFNSLVRNRYSERKLDAVAEAA